jgi:hypothetical protein
MNKSSINISVVNKFKELILVLTFVSNPATSQLLVYDNLFVKAEYQSLGRTLSLFHHALTIQIEQSPIQYMTL